MSRSILALLLVIVAGVTGSAFADPPADSKPETEIIRRLDAILKRLDAIEQRLAKVATASQPLADWWVDDRGVMRSTNGHPIGFWGIDGPPLERRR